MTCHVLVVVQVLVVALFGQDLALSDSPSWSLAHRSPLQILTRGLKNVTDHQSESQAFEGQSGQGFALLCHSSTSPPKWSSTAEKTKNWLNEPGQVEKLMAIGPCDESLPGYNFCTELQVKNPSHLNTGAYSCEQDSDLDSNEANHQILNRKETKEVYVYVADFSNAQGLRATSAFFFVKNVHEHQPLVLPCLPSHPDVNVTLLMSQPSTNSFLPQGTNSPFTYSPRTGFSLDKARAVDQRFYQCVYTHGNLSDSSQSSVNV
eukprot:TCALIF_12634-PA protein Name:"Protein of unknown function" AED:0.00 eAED:0.00 QI:16/1/0.5/1/1/0.75/4/0/261